MTLMRSVRAASPMVPGCAPPNRKLPKRRKAPSDEARRKCGSFPCNDFNGLAEIV
jgi:hypothetical protein